MIKITLLTGHTVKLDPTTYNKLKQLQRRRYRITAYNPEQEK